MVKLSRSFWGIVLSALASRGLAANPLNGLEQRNIEMANHAIVASLVVAASEKGRYLCSEAPLSCLGADDGELALALLENIRSGDSDRAIAELLRFRLDAAYEESYECTLANERKRLKTYLNAISPVVLHERCVGEVRKFLDRAKRYTGNVDVSRVCLTPKEIVAKRSNLVGLTNNEGACD